MNPKVVARSRSNKTLEELKDVLHEQGYTPEEMFQ